MIPIDRSKTLDSNPSFYPAFSTYFKVVYENPKSLALTEIDPSRIDLEIVFDLEKMQHVEAATYNDLIKKRLQELDREYILLDAMVVGALLSHTELIPQEWEERTDADSVYEESCDIMFYGTQFSPLDEARKDELLALMPFTSRGQWVGEGHNDVYFSEEMIADLKQKNMMRKPIYAAVYRE